MRQRTVHLPCSRLLAVGLLSVLALSCDEDSRRPATIDAGGTAAQNGRESFQLDLGTELCLLSIYAYQQLDDAEDGDEFQLPAEYTILDEFSTDQRFAGEGVSVASVPVGFLASRDTDLILVFRGTTTISEWITDFNVQQVRYDFVAGGGRTHEGFTNMYESIRDAVIDAVNMAAIAGSFDRLMITGHSLGGALAILAAPDCSVHTPFADPLMYNYAAPRVGSPENFIPFFSDLDLQHTWRIVNIDDSVPSLPPKDIPAFGGTIEYEHIDNEFLIDFDTSFLESEHSLCSYYNALCELTDDPMACKLAAVGVDDCNEDLLEE